MIESIVCSVAMIVAAFGIFIMSLPPPWCFRGCGSIREWLRRYLNYMTPNQEVLAILSICLAIFAVIIIALTIGGQ